jgi:hypothetical protein
MWSHEPMQCAAKPCTVVETVFTTTVRSNMVSCRGDYWISAESPVRLPEQLYAQAVITLWQATAEA